MTLIDNPLQPYQATRYPHPAAMSIINPIPSHDIRRSTPDLDRIRISDTCRIYLEKKPIHITRNKDNEPLFRRKSAVNPRRDDICRPISTFVKQVQRIRLRSQKRREQNHKQMHQCFHRLPTDLIKDTDFPMTAVDDLPRRIPRRDAHEEAISDADSIPRFTDTA